MTGTPNPIRQVTGLNTTADVAKPDFISWVLARVSQVLADATEINTTDLTGQLLVKLKSNGFDYKVDASDTTTPDDALNCIRDANGLAFKRVTVTGDLLAANNLSDLASPKTGFDNISVHGADISSAGTLNLDSATGNLVDVTGTTTITAITLSNGRERTVRFTGALTLTHGSSLVLPGGVSIATAAGDFAVFRGYAAGVVRCVQYMQALNRPIKPAFSANKNSTNQTGVVDSTWTQVTFGTEDYDIGGFFASSAWTPPAGKVLLIAAAYITGTFAAGNTGGIAIYKNGTLYKQILISAQAAQTAPAITLIDVANGTDVYTVFVFADVSSSTATVNGATTGTFFQGQWLSP